MNNFDRAFAFITGPQIEGRLSLDPHDPGNWTGGQISVGTLKGSKYGISAARYPREDIANLTLERAKFLYNRDYWLPHKCDTMEWGKALMVFDSAVNGGHVQEWWEDLHSLPLDAFLLEWQAEHLIYLSRLSTWQRNAAGWIKRALLVYEEAKRSV